MDYTGIIYPHRRKIRDNAEKWEYLKNFVFTIKNGRITHIYGRSMDDFMKMIVFYVVFYGALLIFFIFLLAMALLPMDDIVPFRTAGDSILMNTPGLEMRPKPDFQNNLIRFVQGKPQTYKPYTDHLQAFLKQYENEYVDGENIILCEDGRPPNSLNKVCRFKLDVYLQDFCNYKNEYGYDEGKPCIMFKLNKIYGWEAIPYNESEIPNEIKDKYDKKWIFLTCEGEYEADKESLGDVTYKPTKGFQADFYPFLNQEGFKSPLVMVKFENPVNGMAINVICKAWAKNIKHSVNDLLGLTRFTLLVD